MGTKRRVVGRRRSRTVRFYRGSEMVSAGQWPNDKSEPLVTDELLVCNYDDKDSLRYEFFVKEYAGLGIRVMVFYDAFHAFTECVDLFTFLSILRPTSLDTVQQWMEDHGWINGRLSPPAP